MVIVVLVVVLVLVIGVQITPTTVPVWAPSRSRASPIRSSHEPRVCVVDSGVLGVTKEKEHIENTMQGRKE